jgi:hypothetical protein
LSDLEPSNGSSPSDTLNVANDTPLDGGTGSSLGASSGSSDGSGSDHDQHSKLTSSSITSSSNNNSDWLEWQLGF